MTRTADGFEVRINTRTSTRLILMVNVIQVAVRYIKPRGKNTLEGQVRAELESRGFPEPAAVHQLAPMPWTRSDAAPTRGTAVGETTWSRFRHFKLARQRGPGPPIACGFAIRLEFHRPVSGPIALGYGTHFGLGLFELEMPKPVPSR